MRFIPLALALVMTGGIALAQNSAPTQESGAAASPEPPAGHADSGPAASGLVPVDHLKGAAVRTAAGEGLGEIGDLVLDRDNAQVTYVLIRGGGFLGFGGYSVPVPWRALRPAEGNSFVLDVPEETLRAAPRVPEGKFEEIADAGWQQAVDVYWEQRATTQ